MVAGAGVNPWNQHRQTIQACLREGKGLKDIGREIGCSGVTVGRYCRKLGLIPSAKPPSTQKRRLTGFCIKHGFNGENISQVFDDHDSLVTDLRQEFATTGYIAMGR